MCFYNSWNFLTKIPYIDFYDFLIFPSIIYSPYFFSDFCLGDDFFMVLCKIEEELIFSLREIDHRTSIEYYMRREIYLELSYFYFFCRFLVHISSSESSYPSYEFTIITRLREIVICSIVESLHDIILRSTRSEHDDGGRLSFTSKAATYLYPIHTRKFYIKDDYIVVIIDCFHIAFCPYSA